MLFFDSDVVGSGLSASITSSMGHYLDYMEKMINQAQAQAKLPKAKKGDAVVVSLPKATAGKF